MTTTQTTTTEDTMMLRNTLDRFGTTDAFEYASREDAVQQMQPTILDWAEQKWLQDEDTELSHEEYVTYHATKMSAEFEDGLEEVRTA
jgi:hypothetical protein